MRGVVLASMLAVLAAPALSVEPDEMRADPVLEERARDLSRELRCVVCLNQDIDSSNADVARTMRILLRERLEAGDTDAEVRAFFVERYGDFVLFRPPLKPSTWVLWFAPVMFLLGGAGTVAVTLSSRRARRRVAPAPLAPAEARELALRISNENGPPR